MKRQIDFFLKDNKKVQFKLIANSDDYMVDEDEYYCNFTIEMLGNDKNNVPDIVPGAEIVLVNVNECEEWTVQIVNMTYGDSPLYSTSIRGVCSFQLLSKSPQSDTLGFSRKLGFRQSFLF